MITVQSRKALLLVAAALLFAGISPFMASAQTPEQVFFSDAMDGSTSALLSEESPDPARYVYQYALGEYIVQSVDAAHTGDIFSRVNAGPFSDGGVSVDAVIDLGAGEAPGPHLFAGCRAGDDHNGYALRLQPATGNVTLWRLDADGSTELANGDALALLSPTNTSDRIGIDCTGATISGVVNGVLVLTATDETYGSGFTFIGAGTQTASPGPVFAAFDNLEVNGTPADETAEATEEATAEATEEPAEATVEPTEEAQSSAEASATGTIYDPALLEPAVIDYAFNAGPISEGIVEDVALSNGASQGTAAGVHVSDFHTEVRFVMPEAPAGALSIGFCFWLDADGNCSTAFIRVNGDSAEWVYGTSSANGDTTTLDSGPIGNLDLTPGASNFFGLSVVDNTGVFIVNGPDPTASFNMQSVPQSGDISRMLSFVAADENDETSFIVPTDEFYVWDLAEMPAVAGEEITLGGPVATAEPTATEEPTEVATEEPQATEEPGETATPEVEAPEEEASPSAVSTPPATSSSAPKTSFGITLGNQISFLEAGSLTESESEIDIEVAEVETADFYAVATFLVPAEDSPPWDFTIGFRDHGGDDQYRLTIDSDGFWYLSYGGEESIDTGNLDNLLIDPGDENVIEVYADGGAGALALNGDEIATLDLSDETAAGGIWIGTAATLQTTLVDRETEFRDFQVWEII